MVTRGITGINKGIYLTIAALLACFVICNQLESIAIHIDGARVPKNHINAITPTNSLTKNDLLVFILPGCVNYDPFALNLPYTGLIKVTAWPDRKAIYCYSTQHKSRDDLIVTGS